jgi:short subunit dehydrogenase-like uncharacterized protein
VIVFGATGFTGRLVAEHLASRGEAAGTWAMAGRDHAKLVRVRNELGLDVPLVVADAGDRDSIEAMASDTRVVLTTVGPYARFGEPVVAACAANGTDYVDLTGEPQWIRRMIDAHHETAVDSGARIVHSCGFDSIPSDLGTLVAQDELHERDGTYAHDVRLRVKGVRGGASGGTLASMVTVMEQAAADREVARVLQDPYSLLPAGERIGPHVRDGAGPGYDHDFSSWTAPFVMEMVNAKIVRRSNALLDYPWGREFRYGEAVLTGDGLGGRAKATALAAGTGGANLALLAGPVRGLAGRLLPDSGEGPDRSAREAGFFDVRVLAKHPEGGTDVLVKAVGDRDPGYGATSRMIGEAALALAHDDLDTRGGSWTPASALGTALVERLEAHAGVTFTVLQA